jgi:hypothetical protein
LTNLRDRATKEARKNTFSRNEEGTTGLSASHK